MNYNKQTSNYHQYFHQISYQQTLNLTFSSDNIFQQQNFSFSHQQTKLIGQPKNFQTHQAKLKQSPHLKSPEQTKSFLLYENKKEFTQKKDFRKTTLSRNPQQSKVIQQFDKLSLISEKKLNSPTHKTLQRELNLKNRFQSSKIIDNVRSCRSQLRLSNDKETSPSSRIININKKIYEQKINMDKILNMNATKKRNCINPQAKRCQSPSSTTTILSRVQSRNKETCILQRKKSNEFNNLHKQKRLEIPSFRKLSIENQQKQSISSTKNQISIEDLKYQDQKSEENKKAVNYMKKFSVEQKSTFKFPESNSNNPNFVDIYKKSKFHKFSHNDCDRKVKQINPLQRKSQTNLNPVSNQIIQPNIFEFQFGKVIGNGKFGEVYQARHKKTGFLVAIKKIYKTKIKQYKLEQQLIQQIRIQSYSSHSNIVKMYGIFNDINHIYLILQYIQGGTLFNYLYQRSKLPQKQVSLIIKQVTTAIKYLHQNKIAHRDIKPENILFSLGIAKICDFGWSARVIDKRKTYCGTIDYIPPEILQKKFYDQSVDLWCLGVLMYQLLTGKVPFEHKQRAIIIKKILNVDKQKIEYPDFVCKQAKEVIENLLRKNPEDRVKPKQLLQYEFFKLRFE